MKISLVQYSPSWENKISSREKITKLLEGSVETDMLIFPEMTLTGFTMKSGSFFEELTGESFEFFSSLAVRRQSFITAGIIEKEEENFFNTAVIIDKAGQLVASYRKIHPFSYSSENLHYSAGSEPVLVDINGWRTGISICYDLRFPELYRFYGKQRAALIINIANWPDTRIYHWHTLLRARAIENQCYLAAVNRVGKDPKLNYPGSSVIIGPMGNELTNAADKEGIFTAEILIDEIDTIRSKFPFLDDIKLI